MKAAIRALAIVAIGVHHSKRKGGITMRRTILPLLAIGLLVAAVAASPVGANQAPTNAPLLNFSNLSPVGNGAHTTLSRSADGVSFNVHSRNLVPGDAYTVWLAIFNDPESCTGGCDMGDFGLPTASVIWAGIGGIANDEGNLNVKSQVDEGDPPGAVNFGPGLTDAEGAAIHVVIRRHGPASSNPATLEQQLTTFNGGCPPNTCTNVQISVNQP